MGSANGHQTISLTLKVWRQRSAEQTGAFETYAMPKVSTDASFLEMLDQLNEMLIKEGKDPVAFESDCREGICGTCSLFIDGQAHGPNRGLTACQLHMRVYRDGQTIVIEPWRAKAFPVIKDLVVDRSAFDRIMAAGGYISTKTGPQPDANAMPIGKDIASRAFDAATCIGCGACVAACPNASPSLFLSAKVTQLALLPQGDAERVRRVVRMVDQMDKEGFGACTNIGECAAACPKEISLEHIATMKREYARALVLDRPAKSESAPG
jgi:succinate dehydrogenase / fumarate reductase iron-sulfur subunit